MRITPWLGFAVMLLGVITSVRASEPIRFCYEDKAFPPVFLGEGITVPQSQAGALIDFLRFADNANDAYHFEFVRKPWQRCQSALKQGKVDAIVASYRPSRKSVAVYPTKNGDIDESRALSRLGSCFVESLTSARPLNYNGENVTAAEQYTVAIPRGYGTKALVTNLGMKVFEADSQAQAHQLAKNQRVNLALALCQINDYSLVKPEYALVGLRFIKPVFHTTSGYLVWSHAFYKKQNALAEQVWQDVTTLDPVRFYRPYLLTDERTMAF